MKRTDMQIGAVVTTTSKVFCWPAAMPCDDHSLKMRADGRIYSWMYPPTPYTITAEPVHLSDRWTITRLDGDDTNDLAASGGTVEARSRTVKPREVRPYTDALAEWERACVIARHRLRIENAVKVRHSRYERRVRHAAAVLNDRNYGIETTSDGLPTLDGIAKVFQLLALGKEALVP